MLPESARRQRFRLGILPWMIWGISCLFYFHQYFLRVSINGMEKPLQQHFHITATQLSNVTASFFYAYILIQVPGGILVDHYGPRRMLTFATLVSGVGCFLFACSSDLMWLNLGRVCMGAGAAFAIVTTLTLGRAWFSHERFVILNGLTLTVGTLGAVLGGAPFAMLIDRIGWRPIMVTAGIICIVLAILSWLLVRNTPKIFIRPNGKIVTWSKTWKGIREVLKNRQVWFAGLFTGTLFLPIASFACLWGVPFLMAKYHISYQMADIAIAMMFIGLGVGGPFMGWFSEVIGYRITFSMMFGTILSLILMLFVIYVPHIPLDLMFVLLFFLGLFLGTSSLAFVIVRESTAGYDTGMAFSLTNVFQLSSGAVSLPIIGYLLDLNWEGTIVNHSHVYLLGDYHKALLIMPISIFLSLIFVRFIKEPKIFSTADKHFVRALAHCRFQFQATETPFVDGE